MKFIYIMYSEFINLIMNKFAVVFSKMKVSFEI